jgi:hypothetical protein
VEHTLFWNDQSRIIERCWWQVDGCNVSAPISI